MTQTTSPQLAPERHLGARTTWLRAAVLGANDGLISTASLMVGVAAANSAAAAVLRAAISSVPYDVVLTPFVVPLVGGLVRRLDVDPLRRL